MVQTITADLTNAEAEKLDRLRGKGRKLAIGSRLQALENTVGTSDSWTGTNVTAAGKIVSTGTTGVGYATGAGGAVTQETSKATGVTLSKICGTITTHNAELADDTTVAFVVTNTLVAATDVVVLSQKSGGTAGDYNIDVDKVAAGQFTINIKNTSGGALSEALVINFAVIKAVAA